MKEFPQECDNGNAFSCLVLLPLHPPSHPPRIIYKSDFSRNCVSKKVSGVTLALRDEFFWLVWDVFSMCHHEKKKIRETSFQSRTTNDANRMRNFLNIFFKVSKYLRGHLRLIFLNSWKIEWCGRVSGVAKNVYWCSVYLSQPPNDMKVHFSQNLNEAFSFAYLSVSHSFSLLLSYFPSLLKFAQKGEREFFLSWTAC